MYRTLLTLHNLIRWVVLLLGIYASGSVLIGGLLKRKWTAVERRISLFFTISLDIQLLIGIILYLAFSDWGLQAILARGLGGVMALSEYRFFAVEHGAMMLVALVFAHLGSVLPRRKEDSISKFKSAAIWFCLATILIIIAIPWDRPLFPGF